MTEQRRQESVQQCRNMLVLLNDMTVQGANNARILYLVAAGLQVLIDNLKQAGEGNDHAE